MSNSNTYDRDYRRHMMKSMFQSLFWHVFSVRRKEANLTLTGLADRLGHNKSYISRLFSSPPNWQIDKISDLSDALDVDLVIEARDRKTGRIFAAHGDEQFVQPSSKADPDVRLFDRSMSTATHRGRSMAVAS